MVADGLKLLPPEVRLRASGWLSGIGACASDEDWLGVQLVIVVLSLQIGDREGKRSGDALRRGQFVGDSLTKSLNCGRDSRTRLKRGRQAQADPSPCRRHSLSEELGANGS